MNFVEELKNLDPKTPGSWPWLVKSAAFLMMFIVVTIKVTGNYDDLGKFASDISQLPRIVTLNDISVSPGSTGILTMDATAKTFRYLDEDELAAQKRAAKAGAKK